MRRNWPDDRADTVVALHLTSLKFAGWRKGRQWRTSSFAADKIEWMIARQKTDTVVEQHFVKGFAAFYV